jgi:predicted  nucleic acid-binding Zn-ribbon protein
MPPLSEQLQTLVRLQDLDILIRDTRDPEISVHETRLGFAPRNLRRVERAREELASQLDARLLQTYERMSRRFSRVVVAVERSVCQGCRMSLPTSTATKSDEAIIENCQNCGRILYRL